MQLRNRVLTCAAALSVTVTAFAAAAEEKVDLYTIQRLRAEEREHSKVMDTLFFLADVNGPRLTNSPNYFASANWVVKQMTQLGIDARTEKWGPFGRSWRVEKYYAAMSDPQYMPLIGFPLAGSGSTNGLITAEAMIAPIYDQANMDKYRGKLKGKIVLSTRSREVELIRSPSRHVTAKASWQSWRSFPNRTAASARSIGRVCLPSTST